MRTIEVKQLNYDLTAVAGLAFVGDYIKTIEPVLKRVDKALLVRAGVANSDIVRSYVSSPGCFSTRLTNNSGFSLRHFCSA